MMFGLAGFVDVLTDTSASIQVRFVGLHQIRVWLIIKLMCVCLSIYICDSLLKTTA